MAAADRAAASGADVGDGMRKRNVASSQDTRAQQPQQPQPEDMKKQAKEVCKGKMYTQLRLASNSASRRLLLSTTLTTGSRCLLLCSSLPSHSSLDFGRLA
jgi:hypothetical protein